jgi:hypothetical protein
MWILFAFSHRALAFIGQAHIVLSKALRVKEGVFGGFD